MQENKTIIYINPWKSSGNDKVALLTERGQKVERFERPEMYMEYLATGRRNIFPILTIFEAWPPSFRPQLVNDIVALRTIELFEFNVTVPLLVTLANGSQLNTTNYSNIWGDRVKFIDHENPREAPTLFLGAVMEMLSEERK
jgi:hypothetical protein